MKQYLCPECGKKVNVKIVKNSKICFVKGEEFEYYLKEAVCIECGEIVPVRELEADKEILLTQQYCKRHDLVTIDEIKRILRLYNADKRQLPFLINVGEHTIERYLKGQIPNEKISNKLKSYLEDYNNFQITYDENRDNIKITDVTKRKVDTALDRIEKMNSCTTKIEAVALYIINSGYEITNLALQKLLYYSEAVSLIKYNCAIFENECEAWVHGPVYPMIYEKYKEFGKTQITDCDLNKKYLTMLSEQDKDIIEYVLNNFAIYNGKVLEQATHMETPWLEKRKGYLPEENCKEIIDKADIKEYFIRIEDEMNILDPMDVMKYMKFVMKQSV